MILLLYLNSGKKCTPRLTLLQSKLTINFNFTEFDESFRIIPARICNSFKSLIVINDILSMHRTYDSKNRRYCGNCIMVVLETQPSF